MDSAKRLEQAVEKLESIMQISVENSALDGCDIKKTSQLMAENKELKDKQEQIKLRLDNLILTAEAEG